MDNILKHFFIQNQISYQKKLMMEKLVRLAKNSNPNPLLSSIEL